MIDLRSQIISCIKSYENRCLTKSVQWCCDLLMTIEHNEHDKITFGSINNCDDNNIVDGYAEISMARQLIHQKEYKRAAHYLKNLESNLAKFLYVYSSYMDYERKKWENYLKNDGIIKFDQNIKNIELTNLNELLVIIEEPDSYILYVQALVLKEMSSTKLAIKLLIESINMDPLNWPAWKELANILPDYDDLLETIKKLPDNWMRPFFIFEGCTSINHYSHKEISSAYNTIASYGLSKCMYIRLKLTQLNNICGDVESARIIFENIRKLDPYILDGIDLYSNILFAKQDIVNLSKLVKELFEHSKYRPETCFAAGNLYNAAGLHEKSANYFKQTIRLNPNWIHAWTLLGHEYIELKDLGSAVVSYRKAIELNQNEYRAWYGLGLVYELLKKPNEAVVMFEKALSLRPNDSRILYAVATTSLKINYTNRAIWALRKCIDVGDYECTAAFTLAGLVSDDNNDEAAALYLQFLKKYDEHGLVKEDDAVVATVFLMNHYFNTKQYQAAELYARRATRYNQCLRESESILKQLDVISQKQAYRAPLPTRSKLFLDQTNTLDNDAEGESSDPMDLSFS